MRAKPLPLLALFYARAGDSRLAEFEAVAQRLAGPRDMVWTWDHEILATHGGDIGPRIVQWLPPLLDPLLDPLLNPLRDSYERWLADAAAGCVGCRGVFELWGQGDSIDACAEVASAVPAQHIRSRVSGSWRIESLVLGARRSQHAGSLGARMAAFGSVLDALEVRPVDLENAKHRIWLVEDRQLLKDSSPLPFPPPRYMLLYEVPARVPAIQSRINALELRKRAFLSTSTLPADRAMLLCNLALAQAPRVGAATLLDPYCGSGGILLAAAALGAQTVGSDLDWRLVSEHPWPSRVAATPSRPARGEERVRMHDNFLEAGLPEPKALLNVDVGAPDAAECWLQANGGEPFDALVCDPPYGRREFHGGAEAWAGELSFQVDTATLYNALRTLIRHAERTLKPLGRLVFLAPVRSPKDVSKPTLDTFEKMLQVDGAAHGMRLAHLGVEVRHGGLHRAVVLMERVASSASRFKCESRESSG